MILKNIIQFIFLIVFYIMLIMQIIYLFKGVGYVAWNGLFLWLSFMFLILLPKYWRAENVKNEVDTIRSQHNVDWLKEVVKPK